MPTQQAVPVSTVLITFVVIAVGLWWAFWRVPAPAPPVVAAPAAQKGFSDAGAELACRAFIPLAQDANAGTLTHAEFRDGMKLVYGKAKLWPNSKVARASAALLQFLTNGTTGTQKAADDEMKALFLNLMKACAG